MVYLKTYEERFEEINYRKLKKREVENIIWDAEDMSKIELFWDWVEKNARHFLLKFDSAEVVDYMTTDEMERFLKYYEMISDTKKYNL
jgi:Cys-tRNA synthase (O-phospho-L-seryl-tRNA:Cys-tRNA synthase)